MIYKYRDILKDENILKDFKSRDNITLLCDGCQGEFLRSVKTIRDCLNIGREHSFCSTKCSTKHNDKTININCKQCDKQFKRTKNNIKEVNFCNKKCAAIYNGKKYPKKKKEKTCESCPTKIYANRTYCKPCYEEKFLVDWNKITYGELKGRYQYQRNTRIRSLARKKYFSDNRPNKCYNCGYEKHVEICHIKAISDHEDGCVISDINSKDNTIALCPNCHWELDYGELTIEDILESKKEP